MKHTTQQKLLRRKRRIQRRLRERRWKSQDRPMLRARNIRYEVADRTRGLSCGGIGAMHLVACRTGLIEAIDRHLHLFKVHLPYHESDHVLNLAYNILAGGTCLEDLELLRNDEVYLDALRAQRIPDPTTAGDFCRRFGPRDVQLLTEAINEVRLGVWKRQPPAFLKQAIIDSDGTMAPTFGQCKAGMGLSYDGQWGYHPLVISLANTKEPLYLTNRSGNRPSHEGAAEYLDRAIALCRRAGFKSILLRGDTDFTQTTHLDRWDGEQAQFIFGIDAMKNLIARAEQLPRRAWKQLERPIRRHHPSRPRARPPNVKEQIVIEKQYQNIKLLGEQVAEFDYRPTFCQKHYRVVALRKNLSVEKGQQVLFDDIRYFFYITNCRDQSSEQIVLLAHERCDQENLIEQLKNGVRAMQMPTHDLTSNWAYMVMASLAWTLKAWFALLLPANKGRWHQQHVSQKQTLLGMEFKNFANALIRLPCQIVRTGRLLVYRLLSFNPWQTVLLRGAATLVMPLRC